MIRKMMTALAAGAALCAATAASAASLEAVKAKGHVQCGVTQGLPGFSSQDSSGNWMGIDVDFCRAMAAAIFGDADMVKYSPLSAKERFTALQSGEIDVLSRTATWTMSRDTSLGLDFSVVNFYDGQGFLVRKDLGISSSRELDGVGVCSETGTTTELNAADYFRTNGLDNEIVVFEKVDEAVAAYESGRCEVYTGDQSALYAHRLKLGNPDEHMVLPEVISKEPLGPVVVQGDAQWLEIVKWVHFAMLNAEEYGVTSQNVDEMLESDMPEIRRLLGSEGEFGMGLGLGNDWAYQIVKQVGNYGETFDRNVGTASALGISRGQNALWSKGGLQYGMPIR